MLYCDQSAGGFIDYKPTDKSLKERVRLTIWDGLGYELGEVFLLHLFEELGGRPSSPFLQAWQGEAQGSFEGEGSTARTGPPPPLGPLGRRGRDLRGSEQGCGLYAHESTR